MNKDRDPTEAVPPNPRRAQTEEVRKRRREVSRPPGMTGLDAARSAIEGMALGVAMTRKQFGPPRTFAEALDALEPSTRHPSQRPGVEHETFTPTPEDVDIEQALREARHTLHQADIVELSGRPERVVKKRLPVLEAAGRVHRPHGPRKGYALKSHASR